MIGQNPNRLFKVKVNSTETPAQLDFHRLQLQSNEYLCVVLLLLILIRILKRIRVFRRLLLVISVAPYSYQPLKR